MNKILFYISLSLLNSSSLNATDHRHSNEKHDIIQLQESVTKTSIKSKYSISKVPGKEITADVATLCPPKVNLGSYIYI